MTASRFSFPPGENHKEYFQFLVNAVGTRQDLYYNEFSDATWNGQWQAASHIGQDFWSVEIAIPYTDLGVTPKDGEVWRLNIGREVRHDDEHVEILAWSPTYSDRLGDPEYFGQLRFSGTPSPRLTLRSHDFSGDKVRATLDATAKADFTIDVIASANEDRAVASQKLDVSQLGKPLELDVKYSPSWNDFALCLAVKDTASGKLLYQSPQYPLAPQPLAPRLSQARVELSRMRADMALLKCGAMDKQYVVIPHPAFRTILPDELPDLGLFGKPVSITSCQDEYQPATFRVFSVKDLEQVRVELKGDLTSGDKALAKENIDLRVVKVWYQGGAGQKFSNTTLAPELLLKDDNLVDIDGKSGRNVLRFNGLPADGPDFKPFDIPAYTGKQVWLTAHIPPRHGTGDIHRHGGDQAWQRPRHRPGSGGESGSGHAARPRQNTRHLFPRMLFLRRD